MPVLINKIESERRAILSAAIRKTGGRSSSDRSLELSQGLDTCEFLLPPGCSRRHRDRPLHGLDSGVVARLRALSVPHDCSVRAGAGEWSCQRELSPRAEKPRHTSTQVWRARPRLGRHLSEHTPAAESIGRRNCLRGRRDDCRVMRHE